MTQPVLLVKSCRPGAGCSKMHHALPEDFAKKRFTELRRFPSNKTPTEESHVVAAQAVRPQESSDLRKAELCV